MSSKTKSLKRGDIIWLNFDPTKGNEQKGFRPAVILSPEKYNKVAPLVQVAPITSKVKGYPFEVEISSKKVKGAVLVDHLRAIDPKKRKVKPTGEKVKPATIKEIQRKIALLLL